MSPPGAVVRAADEHGGGGPLDGPGSRFQGVLGVFTDVEHWRAPGGELLAFEPYVREMRIWAQLFTRVVICAPPGMTAPAGGVAPYHATNVHWQPIRYSQRRGLRGRAHRLAQLAALVAPIHRLVRGSDLVLLRSPSHIAMVARPIARLHGRRALTKWAGFFGSMPGQPLTRRLERNMVQRMAQPALVYGGASRSHLIPFIPAFMSDAEIARARRLSEGRVWSPPWRLLSVGRLSEEKGHDITIEALALLRDRVPSLAWRHRIAGDGPESDRLRRLVAARGLEGHVTFQGALPFERVQELYAEAHVLIQSSRTEGYVKTVPEAWAHGAVPVASRVGHTPEVMHGTDAGILADPDPCSVAEALHALLADPARMRAMSERGYRHVPALSLETFTARLERVLVQQCGL